MHDRYNLVKDQDSTNVGVASRVSETDTGKEKVNADVYMTTPVAVSDAEVQQARKHPDEYFRREFKGSTDNIRIKRNKELDENANNFLKNQIRISKKKKIKKSKKRSGPANKRKHKPVVRPNLNAIVGERTDNVKQGPEDAQVKPRRENQPIASQQHKSQDRLGNDIQIVDSKDSDVDTVKNSEEQMDALVKKDREQIDTLKKNEDQVDLLRGNVQDKPHKKSSYRISPVKKIHDRINPLEKSEKLRINENKDETDPVKKTEDQIDPAKKTEDQIDHVKEENQDHIEPEKKDENLTTDVPDVVKPLNNVYLNEKQLTETTKGNHMPNNNLQVKPPRTVKRDIVEQPHAAQLQAPGVRPDKSEVNVDVRPDKSEVNVDVRPKNQMPIPGTVNRNVSGVLVLIIYNF